MGDVKVTDAEAIVLRACYGSLYDRARNISIPHVLNFATAAEAVEDALRASAQSTEALQQQLADLREVYLTQGQETAKMAKYYTEQLAEREVALQQISQWVRHYKKNSIDRQRLIQRIGALTNLTKDQTDAG